MPTQLTVFFLFVAVLALIGVAAWLVRRFASSRIGANANRGRMPRLAVIDAAAVDNRRRLVLVRRDNIEHLLMIGGPTDIVVEQNIVRAAGPQREPAMPRGPVGAELPPRVAPLPDANWSEPAVEIPEPAEPAMPELPPRPVRPSFADEIRRAAPAAERRADPLAGIAPEPLVRAEPPARPRGLPRTEPLMPRPEPAMPREALPPRETAPRAERESVIPRIEREAPAARSEREAPLPRSEREPLVARETPREAMPLRPAPAAEPKPAPQRAERPAPAPAPTLTQSAEQNLAEMAQRLEAALRRPAEPPATDRAPPVAPEAPVRPARSAAPEPAAEPAPPQQAPAPGPRISFENLEDEMASLLGRPKTPS